MQRYTLSLIREESDVVVDVITRIHSEHKFAMDLGRKIEHQWLETCGHQVFGELLFSWLRNGKVEFFQGKLHEQHRKHLHVKCGFPFTVRHEGVFISVAAEAFPHILVGDDLDFWAPTEKGCSSERRTRIMSESKGEVCKYLRRTLGIQVVDIEHAFDVIGPGG
jgi:hypothetical protein